MNVLYDMQSNCICWVSVFRPVSPFSVSVCVPFRTHICMPNEWDECIEWAIRLRGYLHSNKFTFNKIMMDFYGFMTDCPLSKQLAFCPFAPRNLK